MTGYPELAAATPTAAIRDYVVAQKYSRLKDPHLPTSGKETWAEVITRYFSTFYEKYPHLRYNAELKEVYQACLDRVVAGSMRGLQYGGKAALVNNARLYNCWTTYIRDNFSVFGEILWLLLSGGGVGFGVFRDDLETLPNLISEEQLKTKGKYGKRRLIIGDTIEGWADSFDWLFEDYQEGINECTEFDYSLIRPAGAPLITSGGLAPSYKGLERAHLAVREVIEGRILQGGEKLTSTDALDIVCHLAEAVLSGGNRRSALLAAFDPDDKAMMAAKTPISVKSVEKIQYVDGNGNLSFSGEVIITPFNPARKSFIAYPNDEAEANQWVETFRVPFHVAERQRQRVNISGVYQRGTLTQEKVTEILFYTKQFGEPAFIFADDLKTVVNPCAEIAMLPRITKDNSSTSEYQYGAQACNLSSINVGKLKSREDFLKACRHAAILGTLQASFTDFKYLSRRRENASEAITKEEALLGVSLTGILNTDLLLNDEGKLLQEGAQEVIATNIRWAKELGINPAARLTTIKPDGTVVFPFETFASGIHPAHAHKFFRRVRVNKLEPPFALMQEANPAMVEDDKYSETDAVMTFPIELSGNEMVKADLSALEHLRIINYVWENWCRFGVNPDANKKPITAHNVSCTVIVKDDEWDEVAKFIFEHQESMGAVSFISEFGDKIYPQAPFEAVVNEVDEIRFEYLKNNYTPIDFFNLSYTQANNNAAESLACGGGVCEVR